MQIKQTEIASVYFHIGNGGISFEVIQNERNSYPVVSGHPGAPIVESKSPALRVSAHHFGQQTNGMEFQVRPEALQALGEALIAASKLVVFENESQVVVENPRNIQVGDETWNKSEPSVDAHSTEVSLDQEVFNGQAPLS